jgi:DNA-binding transcriptional regulator YhcF (GntR family)
VNASADLSALRLDASSRTPLSRQLAAEIERRIERGALAPGDRLPPVRELAERLGLAPNTVAKAYRTLEAGGRLVGDGRRGTFVGSRGDLEIVARSFVRAARRIGASDDETIDAVHRALRERPSPRTGP